MFKCEDCSFVFYDYFCGYAARYCKIHGCIDCNPDSYLNTLDDKKCPDFQNKNSFDPNESLSLCPLILNNKIIGYANQISPDSHFIVTIFNKHINIIRNQNGTIHSLEIKDAI